MSDTAQPASTQAQLQALARQILGIANKLNDVPAHLQPIAAPIAEAVLVRALQGGDAQAIVEKAGRVAELGRQLIAELKD